ncbi:MAG: septum formation initiator family protein [Geodermatophilaceae bacterium]|nr:septum formation initiator family protein [Geodermatophilaceae bacterium]
MTGRAVLLGVVLCALVLSLAYPIKEYVGQRGQIATLEQTARETQARVDALEEVKAQLQDPAYIEAQARERLHYAMPGDRVFIVVGGEAAPVPAEPAETAAPADGGSWLERLGESVRRADSG